MSTPPAQSRIHPSKLNQPLDKPIIKFHLSPTIVHALKYLDTHQNSLSKQSQLVSDKLLNIIDQFPDRFVDLESDDEESPSPDPESTTTTKQSSNPESLSVTLIDTSKNPKTKTDKPFLPPLLHSLPTDDEIKKEMLHQKHIEQSPGCIDRNQLQQLNVLLKELKYPSSTHLHTLLKNATLCTYESPQSNYTPEFAAHLQLLRERHQKREFEEVMATLPSRLNSSSSQTPQDRNFLKNGLQMAGMPINMVAVAGTISFVSFWIAKTINQHNRLFHWSAAIIGLLLGFILEVLLFVIRDFNETKYKRQRSAAEDKQDKMQFLNIIRGNIMYGRVPTSGVSQLPTFKTNLDQTANGPQNPQISDAVNQIGEKAKKYADETKKQR